MHCEANCIQRLGDIALQGSDHNAARTYYDEALRLYERIREERREPNPTARGAPA
jgi:hypothetical protein